MSTFWNRSPRRSARRVSHQLRRCSSRWTPTRRAPGLCCVRFRISRWTTVAGTPYFPTLLIKRPEARQPCSETPGNLSVFVRMWWRIQRFRRGFFRWIRRSAWHLLGERGIRSGKMIPARAEGAMNGDENGCENGNDIGGGVQNGAAERAPPCISITSRAAGNHRSLVTSPTPNPPCAP